MELKMESHLRQSVKRKMAVNYLLRNLYSVSWHVLLIDQLLNRVYICPVF